MKHAKPRAKKVPVQKVAPVVSAPKANHQPADKAGPRVILEGCPGEVQIRRERGVLVLRIYGIEAVLDRVSIVVKGD